MHALRYKYAYEEWKGQWYPLYFDYEQGWPWNHYEQGWPWNHYYATGETLLGPEEEPTPISFATQEEAEQFINDPHNRFPED